MPSVQSVRNDSMGPMGLRIAVIGAQTAAPESANPYTVYRTVVTYEGQCFERLIRYSEFLWFYKKLKLRKKATIPKAFPKKKWTRKASLEDDVIEGRQIMLHEFMKEISLSELAPESEDCLFKLVKIGKYEDGSGRVSDLNASFLKSERGERSARQRGALDVVHEGDEDTGDKTKGTTAELSAAATLAATSIAFPAVTSNATTVLTEDERSAIGSQSHVVVEDVAVPPASSSSSMERDVVDGNGTGSVNPRSATRKSTSSSIPPSSYSEMVLSRPQLKASQSLPSGRRSKRVEFPTGTKSASASLAGPVAAINTDVEMREEPQDDGRLSPEAKYRGLISSHLGTISRLLSESETETEDMESSRSIQVLHRSMPLTA